MSAAARNGAFQVPFLRTSNVFWDEIDLSQLDQMSIEPKELEKKKLAVGDLLVCEGGEIGRSAIWDGQVDIISFQNHLHRLRPARHDVVPRFYVYFLQSAFTQLGIFEGAGNKTTIPNLSRNRLAALEVPKPPFEEQQGIVAALSNIRSAIKINEQLLLTAQELKRAAMREMFTRGLRGEAQKQTEIGLVPESWATERLDKHVNIISTRLSYTDLEKEENHLDDECVKVLGIKVSDMNADGNEIIIFHSMLSKNLPKKFAQRYCAPEKTIVFPKRGAAIATNKKRLTSTWSVFDPNIIGIVSKETLSQDFIFQWFQNFDLRKITEPGPTPQLNKKNLEPVIVPVPPTIEEQTQIVTLLSAIDDKITLHKRKKAALEALFTSLLHQLMTGKIRVGDLDLSALSEPRTETA